MLTPTSCGMPARIRRRSTASISSMTTAMAASVTGGAGALSEVTSIPAATAAKTTYIRAACRNSPAATTSGTTGARVRLTGRSTNASVISAVSASRSVVSQRSRRRPAWNGSGRLDVATAWRVRRARAVRSMLTRAT